MANQPKEADRQGQPSGYETTATPREGVDSKVHVTPALERTSRDDKAAQPLGAYASSGDREYADVDVRAHPPGGRRLLENADKSVGPFVPGMVVRG